MLHPNQFGSSWTRYFNFGYDCLINGLSNIFLHNYIDTLDHEEKPESTDGIVDYGMVENNVDSNDEKNAKETFIRQVIFDTILLSETCGI